jgi:hypothetical protein
MDFEVECACGKKLLVFEGRAGSSVDCLCGRTVRIPSLNILRARAGLTPYNDPPELVIRRLLHEGRLPSLTTCARCGMRTEETVIVKTECERRWIRKAGGFSWLTLLLSAFLLPFRVFHWESLVVEYLGTDKIFDLPLTLCYPCRSGLWWQSTLKKCLNMEPAYRQLLDKFPDAKVKLIKKA